ncbi:hypothetical protein EYV94_13355 [Puteibacter caeruleilacunae]|nr:hypothetical protein EYV94_13355 [Puteibacter caeruleilacunae]
MVQSTNRILRKSFIVFLALLLVASWYSSNSQEKSSNIDVAYFGFINDSIQLKIRNVYDSKGVLELYKANINTPVCEDELCYNLEVELYWDLAGNFLKYNDVSSKGLTKRDHIEFSDRDHHTLHTLLTNKWPAFLNFNKNELITNDPDVDVDGVSGATHRLILEETVEGAVYTCFVLWHIVNDHDAIHAMSNNTRKYLDEALIKKILTEDNRELHNYLIQQFSNSDFATYLPLILPLIKTGKGYFPKITISKMPKMLFGRDFTQDFLVEEFENLDYFSRTVVLKKLQNMQVSNDLLYQLLSQVSNRNSVQNELIFNLVCSNQRDDSFLEYYEIMCNNIIEGNIPISEDVLSKICTVDSNSKEIKKLSTQLKRYYKKNN